MKRFLPGFCLIITFLLPIKSDGLTIDQAVELALSNDPALQAARAEVQSAHAEAVLSGRWENPELEFEAEGIGDNGNTDAAEYTAFISQSIPAFGRTRQSRRAADEATRAAQSLLTHAVMDTEAAVRVAYVDVLASRELARIADEHEKIAQEAVEAARKKNEAGAVPERDVLQAQMALERAGLEKEQAVSEANLSLERLSSRLGKTVTGSDLTTDFHELPNLQTPDSLPDLHPILIAMDAEFSAAEAERNLAASSSISGITLGAGVRYEEESEENSYLFGLSIPLPLYTRGSHASAPAAGRMEAVRAQRAKQLIELQTAYREARASYRQAKTKAERHKSRLLPVAEKVYQQSMEAYTAGSLSWLELLESQQLLIETQVGYVEAARDVHFAAAELGRFITKNLEN